MKNRLYSHSHTYEECPDGSALHRITNETGEGTLHFYPVTPGFLISIVDFSLEFCPYIGGFDLDYSRWILVNYCREGRCEVTVPGGRATIVKQGDCCVSYGTEAPDIYLYPLGFYRGVEFFIRLDLLCDPAFQLLRDAGIDLESWAGTLRPDAVVFENDARLNAAVQAAAGHIASGNAARAKLSLIEFLLNANDAGLHSRKRMTYYSQSQIEMTRRIHARLTSDLSASYDLKELANLCSVSVGTLNNYFRGVYGDPIPTYIRKQRMRAAAKLLTHTGLPIYEIAAQVGYSNASKFSHAFSKLYEMAPWDYRHYSAIAPVSRRT